MRSFKVPVKITIVDEEMHGERFKKLRVRRSVDDPKTACQSLRIIVGDVETLLFPTYPPLPSYEFLEARSPTQSVCAQGLALARVRQAATGEGVRKEPFR